MDRTSWFEPVTPSAEFEETAPAEPYAGTEIGQDRRRDKVTERQRRIRHYLANSGNSGATAREVLQYLQKTYNPTEHHGNVSGSLSAMHKDGVVTRLRSRRDGYSIYVLPAHVAGRESIAHGNNKPREEENVSFFGTKERETSRLAESMEREKALNVELSDLRARLTSILDLEDKAAKEMEETYSALKAARMNADAMRAERDRLLDTNAELGKNLEVQQAVIEKFQAEEVRLTKKAHDLFQQTVSMGEQLARPRKTITADEMALLENVGKALEKYPSDGTKDSPAVLKMKVKTLRTLAAALARVVSD